MTHPDSESRHRPTPRDMVMLEVPVEVKVSPDGLHVAFCVRTTHWQDNRYETVCRVCDLTRGTVNSLTRSGTVIQMEWVDATTLALLRKGTAESEKAQVYLYEGLIGEGWAVTDHKTGVEWFHPFAGGFLFRAPHPDRDENKPRTDRFGKFRHFEQEESASALYYVGLAELRRYQARAHAATEDEAKELVKPVVELSRLLEAPLSIGKVVPSPAGESVYLNCRIRDDLVYFRDTSAYCIELDAREALAEYLRRETTKKGEKTPPADSPETKGRREEKKEDCSYLGRLTALNLPRFAHLDAVSPCGRKLLIAHQARDERIYTLRDLWMIDRDAALGAPDAGAFLAAMRNLTAPLDRQAMGSRWVNSGIFAVYVDGTSTRVARFAEDGQITPLELPGIDSTGMFDLSEAGCLALIGASAQTYQEVYLAAPPAAGGPWSMKRLTDFGQAVENWDLGTVEVVRWPSKDGTVIEGVLRKPADFDPTRKYPLLFVVHGGPLAASTAVLLSGDDRCYYPSVQFVNRGFLVLKPNYRGSMGRGQAFQELNVNNLGVGDQWDLESAIDHLAGLGWVDPERVGAMGWSQGGYISAFVGLHSDRFRAVSVGAGVSDWYTYHVSNDVPFFTVDYLSDSPFRNRSLYHTTAPMSSLDKARTPMLIQHGSDDRRVPLSNAMELYRGLKEMGVPVELFVYPGMGHPISKPRESHAVMHQNLAWFCHHLLGDELELE